MLGPWRCGQVVSARPAVSARRFRNARYLDSIVHFDFKVWTYGLRHAAQVTFSGGFV